MYIKIILVIISYMTSICCIVNIMKFDPSNNSFRKTVLITADVAKENTANILFYWHGSGAHYIALYWNGKKFVGYNVYIGDTGPRNLGNSISKFLSSMGSILVF